MANGKTVLGKGGNGKQTLFERKVKTLSMDDKGHPEGDVKEGREPRRNTVQ